VSVDRGKLNMAARNLAGALLDEANELAAAVAITASWRPALPWQTPGQLEPEFDLPQPVDGRLPHMCGGDPGATVGCPACDVAEDKRAERRADV